MMARLLEVTPRTVRRWKAHATKPRRARGRPAKHPERAAVWALARAWRRMGHTAGWRPLQAALAAVPRRHVQLVVGALKRRRRVRVERRRKRDRTRVVAAGRDVLWSLDATHLGRDTAGRAVEGQAVRDVATTRTLALSVGGAVGTSDAVAVVAAAATERGGHYPLVLVTDNGSPYTSEDFERFCAMHRMVHLRSLPHTPRHNPWVERGHRDLKEESGLGKGVVIDDVAVAAVALAAARDRIDRHRPRATLGDRTACAVDAAMAVPYDDEVRVQLAARITQRVAAGAHDRMSKRERRVLRREAVLASLEELELITRTRGGRPLRAVKQEAIT
jgi:transposase InsO family protein